MSITKVAYNEYVKTVRQNTASLAAALRSVKDGTGFAFVPNSLRPGRL